MGTRYNRLIEAVLTCTHNQCFEQKQEKYLKKNYLKINIFSAVKYCCILHGRVFVMKFQDHQTSSSEVKDLFSFYHV